VVLRDTIEPAKSLEGINQGLTISHDRSYLRASVPGLDLDGGLSQRRSQRRHFFPAASATYPILHFSVEERAESGS
jgi:hypothetical protein